MPAISAPICGCSGVMPRAMCASRTERCSTQYCHLAARDRNLVTLEAKRFRWQLKPPSRSQRRPSTGCRFGWWSTCITTSSCRRPSTRTSRSSTSRACRAARPRPWPANGACHCISNPRRRARRNQYLLDFGFTPEVLNRNFDLLGIAPEKLDGLILSHSHRDHYGGLVGFVGRYRAACARPEAVYRAAT